MVWAALTQPLSAQCLPTSTMKVMCWLMWVTLWYINVLVTLMVAGMKAYQSVKVCLYTGNFYRCNCVCCYNNGISFSSEVSHRSTSLLIAVISPLVIIVVIIVSVTVALVILFVFKLVKKREGRVYYDV